MSRRVRVAALLVIAALAGAAPSPGDAASATARVTARIVAAETRDPRPGELTVELRERAAQPGAVSLRPSRPPVARGGARVDSGDTRPAGIELPSGGTYAVRVRAVGDASLRPARLAVAGARVVRRPAGPRVVVRVPERRRIRVGAVVSVPAGTEAGTYALRVAVRRVDA